MLARTSLTTRAFLFSFLPVCVVLAVSFAALNTLVQQHVKERLARLTAEIGRAAGSRQRRIMRGASANSCPVLADSAGLKAAIGLMHEAPSTPGIRGRSPAHHRGAIARDARIGGL